MRLVTWLSVVLLAAGCDGVATGLPAPRDSGATLPTADGGDDRGPADSGHEPDAGNPRDAGTSFDAGETVDSGTGLDAGGAVDSGTELDAGGAVDSGTAFDAGSAVDAGAAFDAGGRLPPVFIDAGLVSDVDLIAKSLMVVDPSVVDSLEAASRLDDPNSTGLGAWSFGHLVENLAGDRDPATFAEQFMNQLATRQTVNGYVLDPTLNVTIGANDALNALNRWCRSGDGKLDLARAPFRLLAIVNRPDLRQSATDLGEMRFVFSLLETDEACVSSSSAMPTVHGGSGIAVIFEFAHPAASCGEQQGRAMAWRNLARLPFGAGYNRALGELTELVVAGRDQRRPNGSQLNQLRVNTGASPSEWTLRELRLGGSSPNLSTRLNPLVLVSPAGVPDFSTFNNTPELSQYLADHQIELAAGSFMLSSVPDVFMGKAFGGASSNVLDRWTVGGVPVGAFNFMTCGGCHAHQAFGPHIGLNSGFLVGRQLGQAAAISVFLRSNDDASGDVFHRAALLQGLSTSGRCATVDAFGVVSSTTPQTVSPGDVVYVNSIAAAPTGPQAMSLRLYSANDADSATPILSVLRASLSTVVTSTFTAPNAAGDYQLRLFNADERWAAGRLLHVALNNVYSMTATSVPAAGAPLSVSWQAPHDHSSDDLIGVFGINTPDDAPLTSTRIGAGLNGSFDGQTIEDMAQVTLPVTAGVYELRMLRASTGARVAVLSVTVH